MQSPFHEGEIAVQRRAGVERTAAEVGRMIGDWIPPEFAEFLRRRTFLIVAQEDEDGRVWASLVVGGAGFAQVPDEQHLLLAADAQIRSGVPVGVLAIEFDTRSRIRVNGIPEHVAEGVLVTVAEAFGNCPKYIQRRVPVERLEPGAAPAHRSGSALDESQRAIVAGADTFFIASVHAGRGADASHRGGRPGFVQVSEDGTRVRFPDYQGNRMFQTLGNLAVDPRAGLLFVDWERGLTLRVSGRAEIQWDGEERSVELTVDAVREDEGSMPARWQLIEPSRLNPPV